MFDNMAIAGEEVGNMQTAIETYTKGVEELLGKIKGDEITVEDGVYGGDQIKMVNQYIKDTTEQINTIVRYFDDFKEKLTEVKDEYDKKQAATSMGTVENAKPADESEMVTVNRMG